MNAVKFVGIVAGEGVDQILDVFAELLVQQGGPLDLWTGQVEMPGIADAHPILFQLLVQGRHVVLHRGPGYPKLLAQLVDFQVLIADHQDQKQDGHALLTGVYDLVSILHPLKIQVLRVNEHALGMLFDLRQAFQGQNIVDAVHIVAHAPLGDVQIPCHLLVGGLAVGFEVTDNVQHSSIKHICLPHPPAQSLRAAPAAFYLQQDKRRCSPLPSS